MEEIMLSHVLNFNQLNQGGEFSKIHSSEFLKTLLLVVLALVIISIKE